MERCLPEGSRLVLRDINKELQRIGLPFTVSPGQETACGLLAPQLLPELDKILVLDSDLIVRRDLTQLYNIAMDSSLIAGVKDFDFIGQYCSGNKKYTSYYGNALSIRELCDYLQGGVLLMNLAQMRLDFKPGEVFAEFIQAKYMFDEQDFLNKRCQGRKKYINAHWNVLHNNDGYRIRYVIEMGPEHCVKEYMDSRNHPWIIHYAGTDKPWKNPECDFSEEFWNTNRLLPAAFRLEKPHVQSKSTLNRILKIMRDELIRLLHRGIASQFRRSL